MTWLLPLAIRILIILRCPDPASILPQYLNCSMHAICLWLLYMALTTEKWWAKWEVMSWPTHPHLLLSETLHPSLTRGSIVAIWVSEGWESEMFSNVKQKYLFLNLMRNIWSLTAPKPNSLKMLQPKDISCEHSIPWISVFQIHHVHVWYHYGDRAPPRVLRRPAGSTHRQIGSMLSTWQTLY